VNFIDEMLRRPPIPETEKAKNRLTARIAPLERRIAKLEQELKLTRRALGFKYP